MSRSKVCNETFRLEFSTQNVNGQVMYSDLVLRSLGQGQNQLETIFFKNSDHKLCNLAQILSI